MDVAAVATVLVAYPFVEWTAHRFVLHAPEFQLFGKARSLGIARNHAAHHANPTDASKVASETGRNLAVAVLGATAPFGVVFRSLRPTVTGGFMVVTGLLTYEITHGLIHSGYAGRSTWYRRCRNAHLRHHYRNENYWYGVASGLADRLLRTNPAPQEVPLSPTARGLLPTAAAASAEAATGEPASAEPGRAASGRARWRRRR
jgi:sterol desaturase/sphingolipid hydroxylase (fatty acid hydroxylase superfamily)